MHALTLRLASMLKNKNFSQYVTEDDFTEEKVFVPNLNQKHIQHCLRAEVVLDADGDVFEVTLYNGFVQEAPRDVRGIRFEVGPDFSSLLWWLGL